MVVATFRFAQVCQKLQYPNEGQLDRNVCQTSIKEGLLHAFFAKYEYVYIHEYVYKQVFMYEYVYVYFLICSSLFASCL